MSRLASPLSEKVAPTLSLRERVSPEATGEGLLSLEARKRRPRRARSRDVRRTSNFLDHPIQSLFHFVVSETKFEKAMTFDNFTACAVAFQLPGVMLSIELDRQPVFVAAKIGDTATNRDLPSKFQSIKASAAKLLPEHILRRGDAGTQLACNLDDTACHAAKFDIQLEALQPLTRPLRGHPLPMGEGLRAEVKR